MLDRSDPKFADALGTGIVALAYSLCGVDYEQMPPPGGVIQGFDKLAPVYMATTEHRDGPTPADREHYSSCTDQLHAILERIGVRQNWVNRQSLGHHQYGAATVTKLEPRDAGNNPGGCPASVPAPKDPAYRPPPGSLCLIWTTGNDAHALVVLGPGSDAHHIRTANYGAGGMNAAISPGANVADSPCEWRDGALHIGGAHRALHCVITPAAIVPYITAPIDLSGAAAADDLLDTIGATNHA